MQAASCIMLSSLPNRIEVESDLTARALCLGAFAGSTRWNAERARMACNRLCDASHLPNRARGMRVVRNPLSLSSIVVIILESTRSSKAKF